MAAIQNKVKLTVLGSLLFLIGLACLIVGEMGFMRILEKDSLNCLYRFRRPKTLNSKIECIWIDEPTMTALGRPPYSADQLHQVLSALDRLGARVIGIEIDCFQNQTFPEKNKISASIVLGLSQTSIGVLDKVPAGPLFAAADSIRLPVGWHLFPGVLDSVACGFACLRIDPCHSLIADYSMPLFLKKNQTILPGFAFALFQHFVSANETQIKHRTAAIEFCRDSTATQRIPLLPDGTIPVNNYRNTGLPEQSGSFHEILSAAQAMTETGNPAVNWSRYRNKIILIGSCLQNSGYRTPFKSEEPLLALQATLLSNFLENDFIRPSGLPLKLAVFFMIYLLILVAVQLRPAFRYAFSGGLLLFLLMTYLFGFLFLNIYFPIWSVVVFIGLGLGSCHWLETVRAWQMKTNLVAEQRPQFMAVANAMTIFTDPFVRVVIFLGRGEKNINLTHTLETDQDCKTRLSAFHRSPQSRSPYSFSIGKLNRLADEIRRLGEIYYSYLQHKQKETLKPIELIRRIGEKIYHEFGLSKTFREIFEVERNPLYLNLVINDPTIPWQWAYDSSRNSFLCDRFPLSFSLAIEKADLKNYNVQPEPEMPLLNQKGVVLLHGNWHGHPDKALHQIEYEITTIKKLIEAKKQIHCASCTDPEDFLSTLDSFIHRGINLRLMHYSGHIEDEQLAIGDDAYLAAGTISQARNLYFYSRPVVFLNGCRSGQLGSLWDKYDDLATEFLACGAAACIITNFDIIETTASKFSETFYHFFLTEQLAVGEALRRTRVVLARPDHAKKYDPDFDITRYFYNLYGDPTVRF